MKNDIADVTEVAAHRAALTLPSVVPMAELVIALPHGGSVTVQYNPYLVLEHPISRCVSFVNALWVGLWKHPNPPPLRLSLSLSLSLTLALALTLTLTLTLALTNIDLTLALALTLSLSLSLSPRPDPNSKPKPKQAESIAQWIGTCQKAYRPKQPHIDLRP